MFLRHSLHSLATCAARFVHGQVHGVCSVCVVLGTGTLDRLPVSPHRRHCRGSSNVDERPQECIALRCAVPSVSSAFKAERPSLSCIATSLNREGSQIPQLLSG
eukprot:1816654-Prymnesium_polylepis.2